MKKTSCSSSVDLWVDCCIKLYAKSSETTVGVARERLRPVAGVPLVVEVQAGNTVMLCAITGSDFTLDVLGWIFMSKVSNCRAHATMEIDIFAVTRIVDVTTVPLGSRTYTASKEGERKLKSKLIVVVVLKKVTCSKQYGK